MTKNSNECFYKIDKKLNKNFYSRCCSQRAFEFRACYSETGVRNDTINTNVGALQARTYAVKADSNVTRAMERLSSGLRINSAADDAAGLAVANKMESQIRGMNMATKFSRWYFLGSDR